MSEISILYDAWPLIYSPNGAQSIHLRALLQLAPEETQSILAIPVSEHQDLDSLPDNLQFHFHLETKATRWQQNILPEIANSLNAAFIHSTSTAASLLGQVPTLISPAQNQALQNQQKGLMAKFGRSLGQGGLANAHILWPEDIPGSELPGKQHSMAPVSHPAFQPQEEEDHSLEDIPESYILYQGPSDENTLLKLLETWTWAASSIGEYYPLLLLGLSENQQSFVSSRLADFHLTDFVKVLSSKSFDELITIYRHATALAHFGVVPAWGNAIRNALSSAKPMVAFRTPRTEALVASAAYLIEEEDLRSFAAAMISVVVDEKITERLEEAAVKRAAQWKNEKFTGDYLALVQSLA